MDRKICTEQGLNFDVVSQHQRLLLKATKDPQWPAQPAILDCCRIDNGGVLKIDLKRFHDDQSPRAEIAGFVPAAGAASRYVSGLKALLEAFIREDRDQIAASIAEISVEEADQWVLPNGIREVQPWRHQELDPMTAKKLLDELERPKALFPCVEEGETFLEMKAREHGALPRIAKQIFVCPPAMQEEFDSCLKASGSDDGLKNSYYEQDETMSTVRFAEDGTPIIDDAAGEGRYSLVPAGHGALIQLFPKVANEAPEIDALFIRNIDNVGGTSKDFVDTTEGMFRCYDHMLDLVRKIRGHLAAGAVGAAAIECDKLGGINPAAIPTDDHKDFLEGLDPLMRRVWTPLFSIFHSPPQKDASHEAALRLFERPLNLMGVVPNSGTDVGGTPVFVESGGRVCKVCLEVPHASKEDRSFFLENPKLATHFNPVFVLTEITADFDHYQDDESRFWLLSKKNWKGKQVRYFETVLFELLGNSDMSNIAFLELPRFVFNPHKSPGDTAGRSLSHWVQTQ